MVPVPLGPWSNIASPDGTIDNVAVAQLPVSDEIAAALARFFYAGSGPSHGTLSSVATRCGYARDDPYSPTLRTPNKEERVRTLLTAALRRPERARELVDDLLMRLRVHGCFSADHDAYNRDAIRIAQAAFARSGWTLRNDGTLVPAGPIDVSTGDRRALDEQLERLRRATDDPGQLLGSSKDLLEAVAKFVLEELDMPIPNNASFDHLWHLARDRLGILPQQIDSTLPGATSIRSILQASWDIARQVNILRGLQGTGHGRTLPTGVSAEMALMVVREACSVAQFTLESLDHQRGRR